MELLGGCLEIEEQPSAVHFLGLALEIEKGEKAPVELLGARIKMKKRASQVDILAMRLANVECPDSDKF